MPRPKGSKNKFKNTGSKKATKVNKEASIDVTVFVLEEDATKLRHSLERIPMLSDDGYRIKDTIAILKIFGYTSKQIKHYLLDGTIPLK